MKNLITTSKRSAALLLGFALCAALQVHAQPFGGFGGGGQFGGGFGGGGGGGQRQQQQSQSYNPSGGVGNAQISIDPDSRYITVIADEQTTRYIASVITNLDRAQPQVLIKVVFVELTHNNASDIGIEGSYAKNLGGSIMGGLLTNFSVFSNSIVPTSIVTNFMGQRLNVANNFGLITTGPSPIPPGAGIYSILGEDFQVTLRAIAQAGKAQLLSRPSVLARNNQPATIVVGQQVPLLTGTRYDQFGNAINSINYQPVGIILRVTPYITDDGLVQMIVQPQTSAINPDASTRQPISPGVTAPVIDIRSADTVVVTPNLQTVVIGGLMQDSKSAAESKIPFLGDIPLLGNLFKRTTKSGAKTELLIFLTPHIIQTPSQLASLSDLERSRSLNPKSYSEEELDKFLDKLPTKTDKATSGSKKNK